MVGELRAVLAHNDLLLIEALAVLAHNHLVLILAEVALALLQRVARAGDVGKSRARVELVLELAF